MPAESGDRNGVLSDRRNIVVIVVIGDEAHRSQYDFIDGFARHMRDALPRASFARTNARAVFGDYISIYDIQRAVEDGATVPIHYEGRPASLELSEAERPKIDPDFEEVTEGEEVERKEGLKSKWAQLAAVVGSEKRLRLVAADLVDIAPVARQLSLRYDRSISWRTATIGAWLPRIEIAAAPA